ncbi:MAG: type VI secretion system-associated FHA domain protein TagH [Gammaproteobacteria bacterium]
MSLIFTITECPHFYEEKKLPREISCSGGSLGRDPSNNIVLPDPACYISGKHALIEFNGNDYMLKDLSTNGTFLNDEDEPIGPDKDVQIREGDEFRIGSYILQARFDQTVIEQAEVTNLEDTNKRPAFQAEAEIQDELRERTVELNTKEIQSLKPLDETNVSESPEALAWRNLLAAAAIEPDDADLGRLSQELGLMINAVTRGLMEILKTRTDVKEEFGVPLTRITPTENNPLKFSVTVEEALENLFIREGSSYMRGAETYSMSLDDFQIHEMATMAAIRAAVDEMLASFDPDVLKKQFQSGESRKSFLDKLQRAEYWKQYENWFSDLAADEQHFTRLFGESFAKAYDEKVHRLAAKNRGRG